MRIYLRKVFNHDVTHEVSVRSDIVSEFFDNKSNQIPFYKKDNHYEKYDVDINSATDPRFGGSFKTLLRDLGDIEVDDIISIRKLDGYFDLEIIRPSDSRYQTYFILFPDGRSSDGRDRHQVLNVDESLDENPADDTAKVGAENILLYGVPGVGKSYEIQQKYLNKADNHQIERVVFHPDYTYADFVGQIMPKISKDEEGNDKLEYIFSPGPFTKILKKAIKEPDLYFYLVIEEINRGNAPAIFGEVFQLLDRKEKGSFPDAEEGESEYGITNYDVAKEVYDDLEHEVRIPGNLYILATMNTADQNVFTLDTAFQRRWNMKHIRNNVLAANHAKEKIVGTNITWGAFALVINELVIEANADMVASEDKRLGAYFAKVNELIPEQFSEKVLKYLWDDAFKINREEVFRDEFKSLDSVIEKYEEASGDRLEAVLRMGIYEKMVTKMLNDNNSDGVSTETME